MQKFPDFLRNLDPKIYSRSRNYLTVDFETTNKDKGSALNKNNEIVLWVARHSNGSIGSGTTRESFTQLIKWINSCDFIICHNAKFELQWLYRSGVDPGSVLVFDTMLAEYVIQGNRKVSLRLDDTAPHYGLGGKEHFVSTLIEGGVCPSEIPPDRLYDYCLRDVEITEQLFLEQLPVLEFDNLLPVVFTRCLTCLVLSDIEFNGMTLDKKRVKEEYDKYRIESQNILGELHEITGGINPKSPKQIGEFLYDNLGFDELRDGRGTPIRTAKGGRKTDEATILLLHPTTEKQRRFVSVFTSYIPLKKKLETLTKFNDCVDNNENLYFNFNQAVTRTHRLSSSGRKYKVQAQNIDRDFKRLFTTRHAGWLVGDADAPQLEFRVAAHLGKDEAAKQDIRDKFDVHRYTASIIFKEPFDKVSKHTRTAAKPFTFKPLFGGTSGTKDEKRYYVAFKKKYKQLVKEQTEWKYVVLKDKKLKTSSGLIFYWPNATMSKDGNFMSGQNDVFNYPIQSLATAEIIPISLVYLWYRMKLCGLKSFITNTVHDSVALEIDPEEQKAISTLTEDAFTKDCYDYLTKVYGIKLTVALGVAYNFDKHWGCGIDVEFEVAPDVG